MQDTVESVDPESLENLPVGLDVTTYQWTDLHGEGIPGILTEQADAWFYKRNLSPISGDAVAFAPLERVAAKPNLSLAGGARFLDLAGDGQPDLAVLDDPNLRFVDLNGDGHAGILITEEDALVWHPSLAEEGFAPARRVAQSLDEEQGPRLVFADGAESIHLADLLGNGTAFLVWHDSQKSATCGETSSR